MLHVQGEVLLLLLLFPYTANVRRLVKTKVISHLLPLS